MRGLRARRLSPAMVVAVVALVMATVGTGYAAFKLPKNSVGTNQIKKNAVTGAKVKNQSLTGSDINVKTLGTVPSADTANTAKTASTANGLAPLEATHQVGAPGQPPFLGGSQNNPESLPGVHLQSAGFYKDHDGIVHLQGVVKVGEPGLLGFAPVFPLPPGFRPAANTVVAFSVGTNRILIAGAATSIGGQNIEGVVLGSEGEEISLDGISFRAES